MKTLLIFFGGIILLIFAGVIASNFSSAPSTTETPQNALQQESEVSQNEANPSHDESNEQKQKYEVLKHEKTGGTERWINAALLVDSQDQDLLKQIAFDFRESQCDVQCNIEIWDNREAFEAQQEYDRLVGEWKFDEADVVKCASEDLRKSHLVGWTNLFAPDEWDPYPIQDEERDPLCSQ